MSQEDVEIVRRWLEAFEDEEGAWLLRRGMIVYLFEYADRATALEAAGLPDNLFGKVPFEDTSGRGRSSG